MNKNMMAICGLMACGLMFSMIMYVQKIKIVSSDQEVMVEDVSHHAQSVVSIKPAVCSAQANDQVCKCECRGCANVNRELAWKNRKKYPNECVSIIDLSELRDMRKAMWQERNNMAVN